jgi:hypothetical protein
MKRALLSVIATFAILCVATTVHAGNCHHGGHGYGYGHYYSAPRVTYYSPPAYAPPCYSPPPCYAAAPACPPAPCQAAAAPQQPSAADPSVTVLISLLAELLKANAASAGR